VTRADVRAVTGPPDHHFFGYYERSPWDGSGRYLLTHGVAFDDRLPGTDDPAAIERIDTRTGETDRIATTTAWNLQQGSMLQWLPPGYERIAFNDREDGSFLARIVDPVTGDERTLPRPLYAVASDGTRAFSIDFARLRRTRPVCGYALPEPTDAPLDPAPDDDGVEAIDLETGERDLLVSIADCAALDPLDSMAGCSHWLNHVQVAPSGDRFAVIHRWKPLDGNRGRSERLLLVDVPGGDLSVLAGPETVSHFDWRTDDELVAWTHEPERGEAFHRYDVSAGTVEPFAPDAITEDGHLTFSPDGTWALTDTYPDDERERRLLLYELATGRRVDLGGFHSPPVEDRALRCDLHPRWNRTGTAICFDSTHEGTRQTYVADVSEYTSRQ